MKLSVLIPTFNEGQRISSLLRELRGELGIIDEILVVDGGSTDATVARAWAAGGTVLHSEKGRGLQLEYASRRAAGDVLLFLHADTRLPRGFRKEVERLLERERVGWGRFDIRFDEQTPLLSLIALLVSARSRLTRVATGDQAIFVRRTLFEEVGGFREALLFEDIDLCRRLKHAAPMGIPRNPAVTSSRRWRNRGAWRTSFLMWGLKLAYLFGVPSERLAEFYSDER